MDIKGRTTTAIVFYGILLHIVTASEWSYQGEKGPSEWKNDYPKCGGEYQSPVNIETNKVLIDPSLHLFKMVGYGQKLSGGTLVNNGHSLQLNFPSDKTFRLSGGGFGNSTYRALQLHFHWSAPGSYDGSEHTIDGRHSAVEMHIVHIKDPYTSTDQVKDMRDGLAVLSVMIDVGPANLAVKKLLDATQNLTYADSTTTLADGPSLISLLPNSETYYRYMGSLTTPPCYETVIWTILTHPISISQAQLKRFQRLKSVHSCPEGGNCSLPGNSMGGNFRPVQPMDGRVVSSFVDFSYNKIESHGWTYDDALTGTSQWSRDYPNCGKNSQSPINIDGSTAVKQNDPEDLKFSGYDDALRGTVVNNGHAVQLNFDQSLNYVVTGGGTGSSYKAVQLHFHWGEALADGTINGGSEHTKNGKRYPAEMHIVHGKASHLNDLSSYGDTASDAYLVLGVFIDVYRDPDGKDNDAGADGLVQSLIDAISKVPYADDTAELTYGQSLSSIIPSDKSFYRYNGSLTTPPCSESVIWTVFKDSIEISVNQFMALERLFSSKNADVTERNSIKKLKDLVLVDTIINPDAPTSSSNATKVPDGTSSILLEGTANHLLRNNYRPLQSLHSRPVTFYDLTDSTVTTDVPEQQGIPIVLIVLSVGLGILVFILMALVAKRYCCGGKKKGGTAEYTAGHQDGTDLI